MASRRLVSLLSLLTVSGVAPARADLVPLRGKAPACAAALDVRGTVIDGVLECVDGDPSCDADARVNGVCVAEVRVCTRIELDGACDAPAVERVRVGPRRFRKALGRAALDALAGATAATCTPPAFVDLRRRRNDTIRPRTVRTKLRVRTPDGRGRARVRLRCRPPIATDCFPSLACAREAPGLPNLLTLTSKASGTDLDIGWTGDSHNHVIPEARHLTYCLAGCDAGTTGQCTATSPCAGAESRAWSPPIPLLTNGVPICLVSRLTGASTGVLDLASGAFEARLPMEVDVHVLSPIDEACPRCSGDGTVGSIGQCSASAARAGAPCTVHGLVRVADSAGNKDYQLSSDCLPTSTVASTLAIDLPLTTGTSRLVGEPPLCDGPGGVPVRSDSCGGGTCTAGCRGARACPAVDAAGRCLDQKGGIAQRCCSTDPGQPCFPSASGGIVRTGSAAGAFISAGKHPVFPGVSDATLAATLCLPATASGQFDILSGLPGPAALLLPVEMTVSAQP